MEFAAVVAHKSRIAGVIVIGRRERVVRGATKSQGHCAWSCATPISGRRRSRRSHGQGGGPAARRPLQQYQASRSAANLNERHLCAIQGGHGRSRGHAAGVIGPIGRRNRARASTRIKIGERDNRRCPRRARCAHGIDDKVAATGRGEAKRVFGRIHVRLHNSAGYAAAERRTSPGETVEVSCRGPIGVASRPRRVGRDGNRRSIRSRGNAGGKHLQRGILVDGGRDIRGHLRRASRSSP